jgi:type II secretory pathway component PulF
MKFKYQARTQSGEVKKGEIEATSKVSAIEMLHKSGLYPTSVKQEAKNGIFSELKILRRVPTKEVVIFTREVAIMIESNVPPAKTFEALAEQMTNATFKEKVFKIAEDIREGVPLSKALSKYPKIFSTFYVSMVRSGEASGTLPEVFNKIAEHLENEQYIRTKTMGAMVYPVVILIVFTIIFIVIVIFIIPGLTEVLKEAGG